MAFADAPLAPAFAGNGPQRAERNPRDPTKLGQGRP